MPLGSKGLPVSIVADGDDQVFAGHQLIFANLAFCCLRSVVRHRWHFAAIILVARVLVNQLQASGIVVAPFKLGDEGEAGVGIGVDEIRSAVLKIHAVCSADRVGIHLPSHYLRRIVPGDLIP